MFCHCGVLPKVFCPRSSSKLGSGPFLNCAQGKCNFLAVARRQDTRTVVFGGPIEARISMQAAQHPSLKCVCIVVRIDFFTASMPQFAKTSIYGQAIREVLGNPLFGGTVLTLCEAGREEQRTVFPITVHDALVKALRVAGQHAVEVIEIPPFVFDALSRNHAAEISTFNFASILPDDLLFSNMMDFQKRGAAFVVSLNGRGMIADEMGLGKTVQAIRVAHHYRDEWPLLVVCPSSLTYNWANELSKWCAIPLSRIFTVSSTRRLENIPDASAVICSYSMMSALQHLNFKVVIVDESHFIKNLDAKRTRETLNFCCEAKRCVMLSGTPTLARPIELFAQLHGLFPNQFPNRMQYGHRYCNAYISPFTHCASFEGHSNLLELQLLLHRFMIRRVKVDVAQELPEKTREFCYIQVTQKERRDMEKQLSEMRRTVSSNAFCKSNFFDLFHASCRAKIPAVKNYVKELLDILQDGGLGEGSKILLFAHHREMIVALQGAVESHNVKKPLDFITIDGSSAVNRQELIKHFQEEDSCRVAILSIAVASVGLNLSCANLVVFAELDWSPLQLLQCEDRVHRIGQGDRCTIRYLLANGTIDEILFPKLEQKFSVTSSCLDRVPDEPLSGQNAIPSLSKDTEIRRINRTDASATIGQREALGCQATLDAWIRKPPSTGARENVPMKAVEGIPQSNKNAMANPVHHEMECQLQTKKNFHHKTELLASRPSSSSAKNENVIHAHTSSQPFAVDPPLHPPSRPNVTLFRRTPLCKTTNNNTEEPSSQSRACESIRKRQRDAL